MNDKISTLLDGELDREEAVETIRKLGADHDRREVWDSYHLIGDVLRGESLGEVKRRRVCADAIFAKLAAEPTVLAPSAIKTASTHRNTRLALAMAASVVTVSAIAVIAMKQQGGVIVPMQTVQQVTPQTVQSSAPRADARVNDYLAIHRQFANPNAFQSASARREAPRTAAGQ